MFLIPVVAPLVTVRVAVTEVEVDDSDPATSVRPPPSPFNPVAPARLLPAKVTTMVVEPVAGRVTDNGEIDVSVGPCTVNGTLLLGGVPGLVTVTFLAVVAAPAVMVKVALMVVAFTTVSPLTVIPPPGTLIAVTPVRLVPVRVIGTALPRTPVGGAIEVNVGAGKVTTVKVTALLVPPLPGAVTVTFLAEPVATLESVKVAVTEVSLTTLKPLTVTPPPETLIAVVPVRPVPVRVTA
jgi:hypothetical protein